MKVQASVNRIRLGVVSVVGLVIILYVLFGPLPATAGQPGPCYHNSWSWSGVTQVPQSCPWNR